MTATESYFINWSSNSTAIPAGNISFAQKFVNITTLNGTPSIDKIVWSWATDNLSGYTESSFALYSYNGTWNLLNGSPNTAVHSLSLSALTPHTIYGILQNNPQPTCSILSTSGVYNLAANLVNATIGGLGPRMNYTCIEINTSNITLDCNGYSITNMGTPGNTSAIMLVGPITNVTVRNCQNISGYSFGIYSYLANNSVFANNNLYNITPYYSGAFQTGVFYFDSSSNNTLYNNSVYNMTYAFFLRNSSGNVLYNNTANKSMGSLITDASGFYLLNSSNNSLINNTVFRSANGFTLSNSTGNFITNNSASYLGTGASTNAMFYIVNSSGTIFTNNTAHDTAHSPGYSISNSPNCVFTANNALNITDTNGNDFVFTNSPNILFTNNTMSVGASDDGVYVDTCSNLTIANSTAYNGQYGVWIITSSNVTLINNSFYNNSGNAFLLSNSANANLTGNTASFGGGFYLSNVNSSVIYNNTAISDGPGFYFITLVNSTVANNTASNCSVGLAFSGGNTTLVANNTAFSGSGWGFGFYSPKYLNITNNTAYNVTTSGFYLSSTNYCIVTGNTAHDDTQNGFFVSGDDWDNFTGNIAYNNNLTGFNLSTYDTYYINTTSFNNSMAGFYLDVCSAPVTFINTTTYHNSYDFWANSSQSFCNDAFNITNFYFLNPQGTYANYTVLSINDTMADTESYFINWSANTTVLPSGSTSFAQKFLNITTLNGTPSIDKIVWSWATDNLSGYTESSFALYSYNGSWNALNSSPNTAIHSLSLTALTPHTIYGILQNTPVINCPVITSSGTTAMTSNYTGAPNSASPLSGTACVVIAASNVIFDCAGYNITNNGTAGTTYGILLNGSLTNVTVQKLP